MPDNGGPNIIDQIDDALTDDAATWTATGAHEVPKWNTPAPGAMRAILLEQTGVSIVDVSRTDPAEDLSRLVGDPFFNSYRHLYDVGFWVGGNSANKAPVNPGATQFVHHLLRDVEAGDYIASDHEREHVRGLLASPDGAPAIHGPCLITGLDAAGEPSELDENFQHWFTAMLDEITAMVAEIAAIKSAIGHAVADALGIPADRAAVELVVVGLG